MAEPTLKQLDRLSIWDINHYWHNSNPQTTSPSKLPLEVQKTLRSLALKASKNLYLRCGKGFIYKSLTDPENELPVSYIRRFYKREFKYVIEGRKYKKRFLGNINMSRVGVLVWCKENGFKPPQELGRKFTRLRELKPELLAQARAEYDKELKELEGRQRLELEAIQK